MNFYRVGKHIFLNLDKILYLKIWLRGNGEYEVVIIQSLKDPKPLEFFINKIEYLELLKAMGQKIEKEKE